MSAAELRREYVPLATHPHRDGDESHAALLLRGARFGLSSPFYVALAALLGSPGIGMHAWSARMALRLAMQRNREVSRYELYQLFVAPMDSVRYFEFDFAWRRLRMVPSRARHLDISSPRLLPVRLLWDRHDVSVDFLNPHAADLEQTERLVRACGLSPRARFHATLLGQDDFAPGTFDTITCISVIEHIPNDLRAVERAWELLRPGGRLVLTLPCAAAAFEEYLGTSQHEYGLLAPSEDGFVYGQRFYDETLLENRVFSVTGRPVLAEIYGERTPGWFVANRERKLTDVRYPHHMEPLLFARAFRRYDRVADLPGVGVVAFEFVK